MQKNTHNCWVGTFIFSIFELDTSYDTGELLFSLLLNLLLFHVIELEFRYSMMVLDVTSIHLKMLSLAYFISIVLGCDCFFQQVWHREKHAHTHNCWTAHSPCCTRHGVSYAWRDKRSKIKSCNPVRRYSCETYLRHFKWSWGTTHRKITSKLFSITSGWSYRQQ